MLTLGTAFLLVPSILKDGLLNITASASVLQGFAVGRGLDRTFLFYSSAYRQLYDISFLGVAFKMDLAWFLVNSVLLIASLFAIVSLIENTKSDSATVSADGIDEDPLPFCKLVWGEFDYHLTEEEEAELQQRAITTNVKKLLSEKQDELEQELINKSWKTTARRVFGWFVTFAIMAGTIVGVSYLIFFQDRIESLLVAYVGLDSVASLLVPLVVQVFKIGSPIIIRLLVQFEQHKSDSSFRHQFGRVFLVRMFFVMTVIFQTLNNQKNTSNDPNFCLETAVGIVFYRLIVFDYLVEILTAMVWQSSLYGVRWCVLRCTNTEVQSITIELENLKLRTASSNSETVADPAEEISAAYKDVFSADEIRRRELEHKLYLHYETLKSEFEVPDNLIDLIYRQVCAFSWNS
jgi:hypothetical protein